VHRRFADVKRWRRQIGPVRRERRASARCGNARRANRCTAPSTSREGTPTGAVRATSCTVARRSPAGARRRPIRTRQHAWCAACGTWPGSGAGCAPARRADQRPPHQRRPRSRLSAGGRSWLASPSTRVASLCPLVIGPIAPARRDQATDSPAGQARRCGSVKRGAPDSPASGVSRPRRPGRAARSPAAPTCAWLVSEPAVARFVRRDPSAGQQVGPRRRRPPRPGQDHRRTGRVETVTRPGHELKASTDGRPSARVMHLRVTVTILTIPTEQAQMSRGRVGGKQCRHCRAATRAAGRVACARRASAIRPASRPPGSDSAAAPAPGKAAFQAVQVRICPVEGRRRATS